MVRTEMRDRRSSVGVLVLCVAWGAIVATSPVRWRRTVTARAGVVEFPAGVAEVQRTFEATVPPFGARATSSVSLAPLPRDPAPRGAADVIQSRVLTYITDPPTRPGEETRGVGHQRLQGCREQAPCVVRYRVTLHRGGDLSAPRAVQLAAEVTLEGNGQDAPAGASVSASAVP